MAQMDEQDARDLLIRIDTKVGMIHTAFADHLKDDAARLETIDKTIKAAHSRMDFFVISGILAILLFLAGFILQWGRR